MIKVRSEEGVLEDQARILHDESIVIDTHSDTILELWLHPSVDFARRNEESFDMDLPRLIEGGVTCQMMAICNGDSPAIVAPKRPERAKSMPRMRRGDSLLGLSSALDCIELVYREIEKSPDRLALAMKAEDIRKAKEEGKVAIMMSIESRLPSGATVDTLRVFYRLGLRCMALSGYEDRKSDTVGGPLDPFAFDLIEEMGRLGMLVDVSHLLDEGFWQVSKAVKGPFIDTHGNAYSLCPHPRNLKDDQLKALAEAGGVIGVMCYKPFIDSQAPSLSKMLDHIDYIVDLIGIDHVGLGMDFDGMGGAKTNAVLQDVTEIPLITQGLIERGYSKNEVKKILGENFLRVFDAVLR
jgi:membrane dipeptidase